MTNRILTLGLAATTGWAATACQSRLTGNEGNLKFSYHATENVADFNKPIAVGAKLDVKVAEVGTHRNVELSRAESDAPEVLAVASFQGDTMVLQGAGSGQALISVTARVPSGDELDDSVNMQAKVPEVLKLNHTCSSDAEALYLVDSDVAVHFDMEMSNGQPVIGYGYHPVDVDPAEALQINVTSKAQEFLEFHTGADKGTVTLSSQIDATTATLRLVEAGDIDGAKMHDGWSSIRVRTGSTGYVHVLPTVGGEAICQARTTIEVTADSPDVCTAAAGALADDAPSDELEQWGFVRIGGKAVGHCEFTVTYPAAGAGQGVSASFTVDIVELVTPD